MGKNKKSKQKSYTFIKSPDETVGKISEAELSAYSEIGSPLFSFKWFNPANLRDNKDTTFLFQYLERLQKLSELGWVEIRKSGRHQFGMESVPVKAIKKQLPTIITPEVTNVHVFRATGDNHPMIGLQVNKIFHVLFIETEFGTIYDH